MGKLKGAQETEKEKVTVELEPLPAVTSITPQKQLSILDIIS